MSPSHRFLFLLSVAVCCVVPAQECLAQETAQINSFSVQGQTYAALDISANGTDGNNVSMMALDDDNKAAFAYGTNSNCISKVWKNGTLTEVANFPCTVDTTLHLDDPPYPPGNFPGFSADIAASHGYGPSFITSDGTVFGDGEYVYDLSSLGLVSSRHSGSSFSCSGSTPQPISLTGPYSSTQLVELVVYGYTLYDEQTGFGVVQDETVTCVASNGDCGGEFAAWQFGNGYFYGDVDMCCVNDTFFDDLGSVHNTFEADGE